MQKLPHFFTKMAITSTRKVQIPKFWCLKSSTSIWPSFGNINSIQKVKNMELEQREGSKLAKIGQFFALKKLNLHFLKNFPRFDFTAFFCDFQCIRPIIIHWQSSWYRTGVVGGMHGWRVRFSAFNWAQEVQDSVHGTLRKSHFKRATLKWK